MIRIALLRAGWRAALEQALAFLDEEIRKLGG
jgi:hypothetical protein